MGNVLSGKALAETLNLGTQKFAERSFERWHARPGLGVVLIGDDEASKIYVRAKERACERMGFHNVVIRFPSDVSQKHIIRQIHTLNISKKITGILVQRPLPKHLSAYEITEAIDPRKDVDGLHSKNVGQLSAGHPNLVPCTPLGCMQMLDLAKVDLRGKHVAVIGRSDIVGKPFAMLALHRHATVTMAHSRTRNIAELTSQADVLVVAVGQPELVRADWVKEGAVVLDVGISRRVDNSLVGDVAFSEVLERASFLSPVPGGVGPLTIANLMRNTLKAAYKQNDIVFSQ